MSDRPLREQAPKFLLAVVGGTFVFIGLLNLIAPHQGVYLFGLELQSISSVNEVRANYGGMHLFLGAFFLFGAWRAEQRAGALTVLAVFTGGLVFGRSVSLVQDGSPNPFVWALLVLEVVVCLGACVLRFVPAEAPIE